MDPAIEKARAMRKAMTPPELRLWKCLRRLRGEGRHFRRQAPFRGYFLDFVCHRSRLVIEVDGRAREYRVEHDRIRDAVLLREGYRTLRFSNEAVRDNIDGVMERIRTELGAHVPHPGSP
ncbi:MAG: endonuclease domain-containing protein [Alphaproteobacteria bacterium]|nr:endonuclease domain-containing protein [Alphaproteobacteria bacterium]MBU2269763.1 endonuclease domain-containing protein [Alphaproteobacteria bacterium]MBU2418763.1 endonuclease domain-containing protein [Alphaproteobacteria bacterium]